MKPLHSVHTHLSLLRVSMSTVAPLHSFWVHVPSHVLFLIHHGAQLATHLHFTNEHLKGRGVLWPEVCQRWL